MTGTEIFLIIVGVIFMLGSFLVKDQLSRKDLDQISKLSEEELNSIIQSRLKNADSRIDSAIDDKMDEALAISTRAMERTSNEKIMAINEYSDTVLDAMDKTHNEIMFLYSMLNDKHKELTDLAGELSSFSNQMRATENAALRKLAEAAEKIEDDLQNPETIDRETVEVLAEAVHQQKTGDERNHNDDILLLHSMGKTDVEIAKELGLGLGEVKLVIGLFKEDEID